MHEIEFYGDEVEAYEAFEELVGPFESIYYMGSGIDRTPSESLEGNVLHVDHDSTAVEYLSSKGLDAVERDVREFNHDREFDLIIISHLVARIL